MYNEERKLKYLAQKNERAIIATNINNMFVSSEKYEELFKKDICDWTAKEILNYYRYLSTTNIQTLIMLHTAYREYARWCLINGLIKNNMNYFDEINSDMLCKCVNVVGLQDRMILDREDFIKQINTLPNYVDRFILLGIFEGIPTKNGDICRIKLSDLNGNILHLPNGKDLEISDELVHIMNIAAEETEYTSLKGNRTYQYIPGDEIIRPLDGNGLRGANTDPTLIVGSRIRRCAEYLGYNLTMKTIREAGRIYFIKEKIMKKQGITKENVFCPENRKIIESIYGHIQNITVYLNLYGEFLDI